MQPGEHVIADYRATGLSLKTHPLRFLRPRLAAEGVLSCAEAVGKPAGARVQVAGLVLVRQRPGGGEVVFITLEDETGIGSIVVWASILETFRREVIGSSLLLVHGRVQRSAENVTHIIAEILENQSSALADIAEISTPQPRAPRHPRAERIIRPSRDFR